MMMELARASSNTEHKRLRLLLALWNRSFRDGLLLTSAIAVVLFAFGWLFVWITSLIDLGALGALIANFGPLLERLLSIPAASVTTPAGLVSVLYVDPVIVFTCVIWGIARGSDVVSGELARGTMEMLLARPIPRRWIMAIHVIQSTFGAALLAFSTWLGNAVGLYLIPLKQPVAAATYIMPAINLFALTLCAAAIAAAVSAFDRYRWRTIGIAGGFLVVQLIIKMVARAWPAGGWLRYLTVFGAFEPQRFVIEPQLRLQLFWYCNGVLFLIAFIAYGVAFVAFERRDLPAPL